MIYNGPSNRGIFSDAPQEANAQVLQSLKFQLESHIWRSHFRVYESGNHHTLLGSLYLGGKMDYVLRLTDWIIDTGYLPHRIVRLCTRQLLKARLAELSNRSLTEATNEKLSYIAKLCTRPIAIEAIAANEQQYEVSTGVFAAFLGPRMKYSCSLFPTGKETLAEAETAMLQEYILKAELKDGMSILDLGCGWGSATLYFAEHLPASRVIGLSNSRTQKQYIEAEAKRQNLKNVEIITGDIADYEFEPQQFDRVVSVEELLMAKIAASLKPGGKLFVHLFSHRDTPYDFEDGWMARYFFTGGTMPSADLLLYFQRDLELKRQWWVSGLHYSKTMQGWLSALLSNKEQIWPHLIESYGKRDAATWYNRWVVYHIAGSEFFATAGGDVWGVSHYLFEKPGSPSSI
ncbi:methyltransferase domain-containing protein [Mollisia scopiformis]|uniref:Methyltransferase domain-containing protein n=1 Tax=Mollisia scopiformis TaxID=149040 RepID=A0A132BBR4_MOLSC|nr:methyltransferase domain-containing protein [Mollisia scopiformis]KUJ09821.1 methyltransferase domain-containing protein [Mollisia scopiformis]